jgi:hypothetical protein
MNSFEQIFESGSIFAVLAFLVGLSGFALAPMLALAQAVGRKIALFAWLICPALMLVLCALATLSSVQDAGLAFSAGDTARDSAILAKSLSNALAPLLLGLASTSLLCALSALLQGLGVAFSKNPARTFTPISFCLGLLVWGGALAATLLLARQGPIPFPWIMCVSIIGAGIGAGASAATSSEDKEHAARFASARYSVGSLCFLAMFSACAAGISSGWHMELTVWNEQPEMLLTVASRAGLLTNTYRIILGVTSLAALLSFVTGVAPLTRALERRASTFIYAFVALAIIGVTAAFSIRSAQRFFDEKQNLETSPPAAKIVEYTTPSTPAAPESLRSQTLPGCLLLHKQEAQWEVASAIGDEHNPCALPPKKAEDSDSDIHDNLYDVADPLDYSDPAREARQLENCPTTLGPLDGPICEGMEPAPTILISGDTLATELTSRRWAEGWQPLRVLTRSPLPEERIENLPEALAWKLTHEHIVLDWVPHFARPEDGVLPKDPAAYRDRAMAKKIFFGTGMSEHPGLIAISEDRDGLFAVSLDGVKRITLEPPEEASSEDEDKLQEPSPDAPVPLTRVLDRLYKEHTNDHAQIVVIPAADWTMEHLLDVCAKVTDQGISSSEKRYDDMDPSRIRTAVDLEQARTFSRCFVHDIPAARWFGLVHAVLDAEKRVVERDRLLRTMEIEPDVIAKYVLHRTIGRKSHTITKCYEKLVRERGPLEGRIAVSFDITPRGGAEHIKITHDEIGDDPLNACIIDTVERARFPKTGETVKVSYPILFQSL